MGSTWIDARKNIPKRKSYVKMIMAALATIDNVGGSKEYIISAYISSCYIDLPPNHDALVRENLKILYDQELIGVNFSYFIKDSNKSLSDDLSPVIVRAIENLNAEGNSSKSFITKYVVERVGPQYSRRVEGQLRRLVEDGVVGITNFYFLKARGKELFNGVGKDVRYKDDESLKCW